MTRPASALIAALVFLLSAGAGGLSAAAQEAVSPATPRLAPGDVLSVSVLARPELSRTYPVRADGTITLHMLGPVEVAGLVPSEVESRIETALDARDGLGASVTVEAVGWREVFVSGDVGLPGALPFRHGLTVGRALAIAGGPFPRPGDLRAQDGTALSLRVTTEAGAIARLRTRLADLHARRLRLEAMIDDRDTLSPDEIFLDYAGDAADALIAVQQAQLTRDLEGELARIDAAAARGRLAAGEVETLAAQQEIIEAQIDETRQAVEDASALFDRGLTSAERVRELRRSLNEDRTALMLSGSYEAQARQTELDARARIEQSALERRAAATDALSEVLEEIRSSEAQLDASRNLVATYAPLAAPVATEELALAPPEFRIHRAGEDGEVTLEAGADTPLLPGDLLEVRRGGWDG